ncbi:iron-containing alcohol dehydrogenase [Clostridium sp. MSJ-4]|uniref:Iron-containing alcohol dehydrogenase n=1 Tax=Clostridium simiarum TaxID=2841506 RepID=A0ABS6F1M3_9CLOT|nr:iron-containing alcohol dehydrogenase [Clostridium simiarum]
MLFNYFMPTKVYFGKNILWQKKEEFKNFGKKAYIVTGMRSSKVNGSLDDVIKVLEDNGTEYVIFDEVEENPSIETIEKAALVGKEEKVDFIIGIGGGSPLDASKAIGIFINNPEVNGENIFQLKNLKSIPVIAVATTSGTGSEVTQYSIVTDHKELTKKNLGQSVFPHIAFLDPSYTMDMSYDVTISTAIDAFTHLVEGYLNSNANDLTDIMAEKGIELFGQCIKNLLENNIDYSNREKLMLASTLGGMVIAQTGTSLPHGMGYPLTYFKNVPHGKANGILYGEYLKVFKDKERVNRVLSLLNVKDLEEMIDILNKLMQCDVEITEKEIKVYAETMCSNEGKLKNHPEKIGYDEIYNIYVNSLIKKIK